MLQAGKNRCRRNKKIGGVEKKCPGTTFCKRGQQDSVGVGLKLDEIYHGMDLPWKFKIGVSGCLNSCSEHAVKDVGIVGTSKGWRITVGGSAGVKPRIGRLLVENLTDDEVFETVENIINYYKAHAKKQRLGEFIEHIGFEKFKEEVR